MPLWCIRGNFLQALESASGQESEYKRLRDSQIGFFILKDSLKLNTQSNFSLQHFSYPKATQKQLIKMFNVQLILLAVLAVFAAVASAQYYYGGGYAAYPSYSYGYAYPSYGYAASPYGGYYLKK